MFRLQIVSLLQRHGEPVPLQQIVPVPLQQIVFAARRPCNGPSQWKREQLMQDFSNASFSPDLIRAMDLALEGAVATLPHPVSSMRVQMIAESILRSAKEGESNPRTLQTMALLEMQLRSEDR
jgi:hypothetical protein